MSYQKTIRYLSDHRLYTYLQIEYYIRMVINNIESIIVFLCHNCPKAYNKYGKEKRIKIDVTLNGVQLILFLYHQVQLYNLFSSHLAQ